MKELGSRDDGLDLGVAWDGLDSARINSGRDVAEQHARDFVDIFGLTPDIESRDRYASFRIGTLAAYVFPRSGIDELVTLTDWLGTWFLLDDRLTHYSAPAVTNSAAALLPVLTADAGEPPQRTGSFGDSFGDAWSSVWHRLAPSMSSWWRCRFSADMAQWFTGEWVEAGFRDNRRVAEPAHAIACRRLSSGVPASLDLVEFANGTEIPTEVVASSELTRLREVCTDLVIWTNDIFSAEKEQKAGEAGNVVVSIMHRDHLDLDQARAKVEQMLATHLVEYRALAAELRHLSVTLGLTVDRRAALDIYLAGMDSWITGNYAWSQETARYLQ